MERLDVSLLLPKTLISTLSQGKRIYYLAGPIRGAGDWQADAIRMLAKKDPGCWVVCPCRYNESHPLWEYRVIQINEGESFGNQTLWEQEYMPLAAQQGCLIFWIPCESETDPRPKEAGPYARDTYGELGRYPKMISDCLERKSLSMVVGADPNLPEGFGMKQIKTNLDSDFGYQFPIENNLETLLQKAVVLAKAK